MDFISLLLLAAGLSMDAFAVAICKVVVYFLTFPHTTSTSHKLLLGLFEFHAVIPLHTSPLYVAVATNVGAL